MSLLAFGINHKTAPVDIRERVAFEPTQISHALKDLVAQTAVNEAAIVSTCNRTELYCGLEHTDLTAVTNWLRDYHKLGERDINPYIYAHPDHEAVRHLLRVASGLDSMVLGEPQILGQMKDAYLAANQAGTLGGSLDRLFQHTFAVAKQVRTDTQIGASPVSVAFAAVSLSKQIFSDLSEHTALLIGAGETIELAARHLHESGIGRMVIANRTIDRAHNLAAEFNAYAIALPDIPGHLAEADIVISSTASPESSARAGRPHALAKATALSRAFPAKSGAVSSTWIWQFCSAGEVIRIPMGWRILRNSSNLWRLPVARSRPRSFRMLRSPIIETCFL